VLRAWRTRHINVVANVKSLGATGGVHRYCARQKLIACAKLTWLRYEASRSLLPRLLLTLVVLSGAPLGSTVLIVTIVSALTSLILRLSLLVARHLLSLSAPRIIIVTLSILPAAASSAVRLLPTTRPTALRVSLPLNLEARLNAPLSLHASRLQHRVLLD